MIIYEVYDGIDSETLGFFLHKKNAEILVNDICEANNVDDPEEIEISIREHKVKDGESAIVHAKVDGLAILRQEALKKEKESKK